MKELDEDGFAIRPNKTAQKRELSAVQELVVSLIDLAEQKQRALGVNDALIAGLKQARGMRADSARKRLVKSLTKQLAKTNYQPVAEHFAQAGQKHIEQQQRFHDLEKWRGRVIEEGDAVLQEFLDKYPQADRQQLRQVARSARKEKETGKSAGAAKKLFKLLKEFSEK